MNENHHYCVLGFDGPTNLKKALMIYNMKRLSIITNDTNGDAELL